MPESSNVELSEKILAMNFVLSDKESTIWGSFKSKEFVRQVLRQFLDLHGNFGNVNKNWLRNFVSPMEKSTSEETYLRGKILVGDMFFKSWESLLYFHEK